MYCTAGSVWWYKDVANKTTAGKRGLARAHCTTVMRKSVRARLRELGWGLPEHFFP